jgi:hypothetical protein
VAFAEGLNVTATLHGAEMCYLALAEATLDVEFRGCGEPVVLIQTAVRADEFLPLARQPVGDGDMCGRLPPR